jgi:hypothetical protein
MQFVGKGICGPQVSAGSGLKEYLPYRSGTYGKNDGLFYLALISIDLPGTSSSAILFLTSNHDSRQPISNCWCFMNSKCFAIASFLVVLFSAAAGVQGFQRSQTKELVQTDEKAALLGQPEYGGARSCHVFLETDHRGKISVRKTNGLDDSSTAKNQKIN